MALLRVESQLAVPGDGHRYPTEAMTAVPNANIAAEWPPQWVNADGLLLREYADAPQVQIEGQLLRCSVTESSKFILWFAPTFGIFFTDFVYPTIQVPKFQTLFLVMAPLSLVSVFAIGYGVTRYHETGPHQSSTTCRQFSTRY